MSKDKALADLIAVTRAGLDRLGIAENEHWYAYIHKGGYDLCVDTARRRPDHPNAATDAIVGRFACGEYAIECLKVITGVMNNLPVLLTCLEALQAQPVGEAYERAAQIAETFRPRGENAKHFVEQLVCDIAAAIRREANNA